MDSLANARMGIELIQSGQRAEAINYLRRSIQVEPVTADVWLWLAHVSGDYHEYSHCVQQALALEPQHHVALQMYHALQQINAHPAMQQPSPRSTGQYPAVAPNAFSSSQMLAVDGSLVASLEKKGKTRKLRRRLLSILFICTILMVVALVFLSTSEKSVDEWFNELFGDEDATTENGDFLQITLPEAIDESVVFEVVLPDTWLVADANSSVWIEKRDELVEAFGQAGEVSIWESVEFDEDTITLNNNQRLDPPLTIIETDVEATNRSSENPPRLQLDQIVALSDTEDKTSCEIIQEIAENAEPELEQLNEALQSVVDYGVEEQTSGNCVFVVHFRGQSPITTLIEHIYVIQVPVGNEKLAEWSFIVIDELHNDYESVVQTVIDTLQASDS